MTNALMVLISCFVFSVTDGDTVKCRTADNEVLKIRLVGIDAPEIHSVSCPAQPYSVVAKKELTALVKGKTVDIESQGLDVYGRTLGTIFYNDEDINLVMIKKGLVEVYRGEPYENHPYYPYEVEARDNKVGMWWLWYTGEYESPRAYRKKCNQNKN